MPQSRQTALVIGILVAVLSGLGVLMTQTSYEVWGGVLLVSVLTVLTMPLLYLAVRRDVPRLFGVLAAGFFMKVAGTILRFYVFSKVYGSVADATYYYDRASNLAAGVRSGRTSFFDIIPWARELTFVIRLTAVVLTFTGPTRLGAFLVFGLMGFWGAVFLVKAACRAIPGLEQRRFAVLCMAVPSIVFWPSSLGKEAWILFSIGVLSLGLSRLYVWDRPVIGLVLATAGGMGIGAVRIHLAAVFIAGAAVAFVQGLVLPTVDPLRRRRGGRLFLAIASLAVMGAVGYTAVNRIRLAKGGGDFLSGLDSALDRAATMSEAGGSSFTPINARNPLLWPWAIARTLTRPLPIDVHTVSAAFPAAETTAYIVALFSCRRRVSNLGAMMRRSPFLTYCVACAAVFGLVFSAFGNLGILVRQRSLVVPFMLTLLCIPARPSRSQRLNERLAQSANSSPRSRQRDGAAASRA